VEYGFLEHCLREDLNETAQRTMAVLHPVKLTVTNYPEGKSETFRSRTTPPTPEQGTHEITFSRTSGSEPTISGDAHPQVQAPLPRRPGVPPQGRVSGDLHRLREGRFGRNRDRGTLRI
jgi:glutaminyl-tRNA synthetase